VPEMNDLYACRLYNSSHDVDGGIVPIEETSCCNNTDFMAGFVRFGVGISGYGWLFLFFFGG
jgi:hypothetical protein